MAVVLLVAPTGAHGLEVEGRLGRWSVGGFTEGYAVIQVDRATPRQRPAGVVALDLTGEPHRVTRLHLATRGLVGGTPEGGDGLGIVDLTDTFQNPSPSVEVEEGYVELFLPSLDVRLGKQKFAWGVLDRIQPTDVLNPRRYTDPFVLEEHENKIGVPAASVSYFLPPLGADLLADARLTLVWVPVPFPIRFPLEEERWFPPATSVPGEIELPAGLLGAGLPSVTVRSRLRTVNRRPPQQLDEGAVAVRAAGMSGVADWSLYYYDGVETAPSFDLAATVRAPAVRRALGQGRPPTIDDLRRLEAETILLPRSDRIRLAGADVAFELGGFTVRVEGAYGADRRFARPAADLIRPEALRESLRGRLGAVAARLLAGRRAAVDLGDLSAARDSVAWGAGVDYRYRGWTPLVQLNQTLVLDNRTTLLVPDVDSRVVAVLRRSFLADRLATELGAIQAIERAYTTGIVRLSYGVTDTLRVRLGYLLLAGTRRSLVGQYHDNDEAFLQLRWAF
jgi:hypothetical protein